MTPNFETTRGDDGSGNTKNLAIQDSDNFPAEGFLYSGLFTLILKNVFPFNVHHISLDVSFSFLLFRLQRAMPVK